ARASPKAPTTTCDRKIDRFRTRGCPPVPIRRPKLQRKADHLADCVNSATATELSRFHERSDNYVHQRPDSESGSGVRDPGVQKSGRPDPATGSRTPDPGPRLRALHCVTAAKMV